MRLIDADPLREELFESSKFDTYNDYSMTLDTIDFAPTIEAAPVKHGRWIKMTGMMPPEYHGHYECSECHWHMKGIRSSWNREEELTYCPNCGATMNKEDTDYDEDEAVVEMEQYCEPMSRHIIQRTAVYKGEKENGED